MNLNQVVNGTFVSFKADYNNAPDLIVLTNTDELTALPFDPVEIDPDLDELIRKSTKEEYSYSPKAELICSYYSERKAKIMRVELFEVEFNIKPSGPGLFDAADVHTLEPGSVVKSRFFNCPYVFTLISRAYRGFWIASYWDRNLDSFRRIRLHENEIAKP